MSDWQEAKHSDGRTYYWNTVTKETRWDKPPEMLDVGKWSEARAADGRIYYYNSVTKATTWDVPEELKSSAAPQEFVAGGFQPNQRQQYVKQESYEPDQRQQFGIKQEVYEPDNRQQYEAKQESYGRESYGREMHGRGHGPDSRHADNFERNFYDSRPRFPAMFQQPAREEYTTFAQAEAAFKALLKRSNILHDASWEETVRAVIKDPDYRALKDPRERRDAFESYRREALQESIEQESMRVAKLKDDFDAMLTRHPQIHYYTRWTSALPFIEGETIFKAASNDTERRQLYKQWRKKATIAHVRSEKEANEREKVEFRKMLPSLPLAAYTRWSQAEDLLAEEGLFPNDDKFPHLRKAEVLLAFRENVMQLERTFNATVQQTIRKQRRLERQNRDGYMALLRELTSSGHIRAGTQWKQTHQLIESDERYIAMLGQAGSTPLDMFWDAVESQERRLRAKRDMVLDILDDERYEVTTKTTLDDFMSVMHKSNATSRIDVEDLQVLFRRLLEKIQRNEEKSKHSQERADRKSVEALRSRIKRLDPPVRVSDSWEEDVRARVTKYDEFRQVRTDELRRSAFDKVIERLREREAEDESERTRQEVRRETRGNGHQRHRDSRSAELDVYEADRRKAIAARERQYHKAAMSPGSRGSRRGSGWEGDAREDHHRRVAGPTSSRHETEPMRSREYERERGPYMSRADPRDGTPKALDYGESGRTGSTSGSAGRRRGRGDDRGEDERSHKRSKVEGTPKNKEDEKEEEALRSGSEEGEIEEV